MLLPRTWRKLLLTLHVAASVGVLGADLSLLALGIAGVGGADPLTIYPAARLVAARLVMPLALAALATGVALALLTPWGLFNYWWVTIKLAIVLALSAAVLFVLVPGLSVMAETVTGTAGELAAGQRLRLVLAPTGASLLLLLAIVLGIFKPGWRLRASAPPVRPPV